MVWVTDVVSFAMQQHCLVEGLKLFIKLFPQSYPVGLTVLTLVIWCIVVEKVALSLYQKK